MLSASRHIARPDTENRDCGDCDSDFTAVAQISYRFDGGGKNQAMRQEIERRQSKK
jgi:hypothetical protein